MVDEGVLRILLVDDHALFRAGMASLLGSQEQIRVVGEAQDGLEAVEAANRLQPDVVLMDVHMPRMDGIKATQVIRSQAPDVRVVMLTVSDHDKDLFEAIKSGACGYLLKNLQVPDLFEYLAAIRRGEAPVSRGMAGRILHEFASQSHPDEEGPHPAAAGLTPREREILDLVATGDTNRTIANRLQISENTVKNHLRNILEKLHVENRRHAAAYALRAGLVRGTQSGRLK